MKKSSLLFLFFFASLVSYAQEEKNIVSVIDNLTIKWDETAISMKTYQDIYNFCEDKSYQKSTTKLLDAIHHWDTTLYFIVKNKFDVKKDREAAATLSDIEKLETEYSTANFKAFIQNECTDLKIIDSNFDDETVRQYEKEIKAFEKELVKYINSITKRIDLIDAHVHHLELGE